MKLNKREVRHLAGYLEGISETDGQIREFLITADYIKYDENLDLESNFFKHYHFFKEHKFTAKQISLGELESKIFPLFLLLNTRLPTQNLDDKRSFLTFRILDYIAQCYDYQFPDHPMYFSKLDFPNGEINYYLIITGGKYALDIGFSRYKNLYLDIFKDI
ncbi:hypothetical protein [Acinetobacter piscicola]|uniref:hypothetical protein n=1 Tax=Acinetobacter piscicola TaxID=2006115 RepID=UPI0012FF6D44|nr:hypothetical protein [Acinetobacter piscicola]